MPVDMIIGFFVRTTFLINGKSVISNDDILYIPMPLCHYGSCNDIMKYNGPFDQTSLKIIVKSIYCANNDTSSGIVVNMNFVDSSDSSTEYEFFRDEVGAKSQVNASPQGLNLEAGDAIKVQSNVASSMDVVLSYLEQT